MPFDLDVSSLHKAAAAFFKAHTAATAEPQNDLYRDACIQRFEFSFELAFKMLRRELEKTYAPEVIRAQDFKDLIRLAADSGLVDDPEAWFLFRSKRNITSHTYDEVKAGEVFGVLDDFGKHLRFVLEQLDRRNASSGP